MPTMLSPQVWMERWRRFDRYLDEGLWLQELDPRTWTGRGARALQFSLMVGEGFVRDRLMLRASALTYFTLLAIVPLLAIVSSLVTALGVTENVVGTGLDLIRDAFPQVSANIEQFLAEADIAGLGTLGAATLFLTTLLGISNIERSLNHIWGVQQNRPWARRVPDYLMVLVTGPLLIGAALSLGATVKSQWVVQKLVEIPAFAAALDLGLGQAPAVVLALSFTLLYKFLPNTNVRFFSATLGGVVAALGVSAALAAYVGLSVGVARANALYGGFAYVPLFFVWVYVFWAIVLFGAEIAFAYQNLDLYVREVRGERAGPAEREAVGLRIAVQIGRAFRDAEPAWTDERLSEEMRVPVRTVRSILAQLESAKLVAELRATEREGGWQLARPAEAIRLVDVLGALRGPREPLQHASDVTLAVETFLGELTEGEVKAAGGASLADLLQQVAPAAQV